VNQGFATWALRHPIPPVVLFLMLTLGGLFSYLRLDVNNMPNVVIPMVKVVISQPGASPSELETQIAARVEAALASIQGVKHITSTLTEGQVALMIEFVIDTPFDRAMADTRDAVAGVRQELPATILEPLITRFEVDGGPILIFTVASTSKTPSALTLFVDDILIRELMALPGVANVTREGGVDPEIRVELDPARLRALGITAGQLSRALAAAQANLPAGRITLGDREWQVRTLAAANSVQEIADFRLSLPGGMDGSRQVRLGDIATVSGDGAQPRSIVRLNGQPAVTLQVFRSKGSSEITVGKDVEKALSLMRQRQADLTVQPIFSLVEFTERTYTSAVFTFFEGTLLTVFIVWLFLRDIRATLIAAITIPLSVIPTFIVMDLLGFSLNSVSLLAITLVTGVLVDDAIVEIENVNRHLHLGKPLDQATLDAVSEIGLAVIATTLVICAVFVPISIIGGVVGQYFRQFGFTVATAALFSLLVARLITPLLAARWMRPPAVERAHEGPMTGRYLALVRWTLGHRWQTLLAAILSTVGAFAIIPHLSTGLFPYEDYSQSIMTLEMPRGTPLADTDKTARDVTAILEDRPEVAYVMSSVGDTAGGSHLATLMIKLVAPDQRTLDQRQFEKDILPDLQAVPDVRVAFSNAWGMKDITIVLQGDNAVALGQVAEDLESAMKVMPGLASVTNTLGQPQPELRVIPDLTKASALGVRPEDINDALQSVLMGDIETRLARFVSGDQTIPVTVRVRDGTWADLDALAAIPVPTLSGGSVALSAVTRIERDTGPARIERYDRQRKISVEANLAGAPLGDALDAIYALPVLQQLPDGVEIRKTGDAELMDDLFRSFGTAILAGLIAVYAIQVLLYGDWWHPLTRMAALPLSIGGAFLLLLITGTDLNMPALIGILMLMGIADKNSILLVDHMLVAIRQGTAMNDAIVDACRVRARPILMTSVAMLAGMLPVAMNIGIDTGFRAPMAVAVIGGLISSTLLSLVFVPVLFSYMQQFTQWISRPRKSSQGLPIR
jgi:multidrug efflux pump subunit AcrB